MTFVSSDTAAEVNDIKDCERSLKTSILDSLPIPRGELIPNYPLSKKAWMGVGGTAEVLFIPADVDDLIFFLRNIPNTVPVTVLGAMSNVLVRDGGISGVVIILGESFKKIYAEEDVLEVGAAVNCTRLSTFAMDSDLGGLEFLMGLPGSVGGALKMNAGCFGSEISDFLLEFEAITTLGQVKWFKKKDVAFSYRNSGIPNDLIITRAWFKYIPQVDYSIGRKVHSIIDKRRSSQPLNKRSCGSTFKNPPGNMKAWELIDKAGCRGMRVGGAAVSEKHCNFIVNDSGATAEDVENLGEKIRENVFKATGTKLEWEVIRIGKRK